MKKHTIYKIYLSSAAGLDYSGIWTYSEEKAKCICDKFNEQDNNPYCTYVYYQN